MTDPKVELRCPECGDGRLVERLNKANGSRFMGCDNWPRCDYTSEIPAYLKMVRQGAAQLPGMDAL